MGQRVVLGRGDHRHRAAASILVARVNQLSPIRRRCYLTLVLLSRCILNHVLVPVVVTLDQVAQLRRL